MRFAHLYVLLILGSSAEAVLICDGKSCSRPNNQTITNVAASDRSILIFDNFGCKVTAESRLGLEFDLNKHSGGEVVYCGQMMHILGTLLRYTLVLSWDPEEAAQFYLQALANGKRPLLFAYNGWEAIAGIERFGKAYVVREPFLESCLLKMTWWEIRQPAMLWPGDLRYYVIPYPSTDNSYAGLPAPRVCNVVSRVNLLTSNQYGLVFGKFGKGGTAHLDGIHSAFKNETLWRELKSLIVLVFVGCSDDLAKVLKLGESYSKEVVCWNYIDRGNLTYSDLLVHARFMIGLGTPSWSPSPVDAIFCKVPVIMPASQNGFLAPNTLQTEYYDVKSSVDVVSGVRRILKQCTPHFIASTGGFTKVDLTCFPGESHIPYLFSDAVVADNMRKLLFAKSMACRTERYTNRSL